jgi:AAA ATPase domain
VIPVLLPGAERAERSSLATFLAATTWVEFRDSLDDADAFHRLVCGIRGVEPGPGPGQAIYEGQCPYRGLRVFDVEDAPFFFGREALVQWLLHAVRPATEGQPVNRFLAIVGASGSGKSSVARAGLVAALKHDGIPGSSRWPVAILRPLTMRADFYAKCAANAELAPAFSDHHILVGPMNEDEVGFVRHTPLSSDARVRLDASRMLCIACDKLQSIA